MQVSTAQAARSSPVKTNTNAHQVTTAQQVQQPKLHALPVPTNILITRPLAMRAPRVITAHLEPNYLLFVRLVIIVCKIQEPLNPAHWELICLILEHQQVVSLVCLDMLVLLLVCQQLPLVKSVMQDTTALKMLRPKHPLQPPRVVAAAKSATTVLKAQVSNFPVLQARLAPTLV